MNRENLIEEAISMSQAGTRISGNADLSAARQDRAVLDETIVNMHPAKANRTIWVRIPKNRYGMFEQALGCLAVRQFSPGVCEVIREDLNGHTYAGVVYESATAMQAYGDNAVNAAERHHGVIVGEVREASLTEMDCGMLDATLKDIRSKVVRGSKPTRKGRLKGALRSLHGDPAAEIGLNVRPEAAYSAASGGYGMANDLGMCGKKHEAGSVTSNLTEIAAKDGRATVGVFLQLLRAKLAESHDRQQKHSPDLYRLGHYMRAVDDLGESVAAILERDDQVALDMFKKALSKVFTHNGEEFNLDPANFVSEAIDQYLGLAVEEAKETEGATAPLRNRMLAIMAKGRLKAAKLLDPNQKGAYGLTQAEAEKLLKESVVVEAMQSWGAEFKVDGGWYGNQMRYASKEEAELHAKDKFSKWMQPTDWRVREYADKPNYKIEKKGSQYVQSRL